MPMLSPIQASTPIIVRTTESTMGMTPLTLSKVRGLFSPPDTLCWMKPLPAMKPMATMTKNSGNWTRSHSPTL